MKPLLLAVTAVLAFTSTSLATPQIPTLDLPAQVEIPIYVDLAGSFTFRMCVKLKSAPDDLPALAANKAWGDGEIRDYTSNNSFGIGRESGKWQGFAISVLPDGAWTWNVSDGRTRLDHRPEAKDQGIADGRWHEVGFAIDREHGVAELYHDGRRVALHDLGGLHSLKTEGAQLQVGYADANLQIGAVRFEPRVQSREKVAADFVARFGSSRAPATAAEWDGRPIRVLAWNIWHGGRRKGRDEGVERVVDVIRDSRADVVLMQETYGSGPRISGRLGFDYFLRSSNLSIMSRYPIVDVHRLGRAFRFGGVTIELRPGVRIQAYSLWINHLPSVQKQLAANATAAELAAADSETRGKEMRAILDELLPHLGKSPEIPVIVGGDFNSASHLDWTEAARDQPHHHGLAVTWPVSSMMEEAGFVDSFRTVHTDPVERPGLTWSPEFRDSHQERIDYVYLRGGAWTPAESTVLSTHSRGWPSDHAAVLSVLAPRDLPETAMSTASATTLDAFEGRVAGTGQSGLTFVAGHDGQALRATGAEPNSPLVVYEGDGLPRDARRSFTVQFWLRSTATADRRMVVLSQKPYPDNSLASQKQAGWTYYISDGTWAWTVGSGKRRLTYERENGQHDPINDGLWHQLTMTYDSALEEVRLFHDGRNKAVYHIGGLDFSSTKPLTVGASRVSAPPEILPAINSGATVLQSLVDTFNELGVGHVTTEEFVHLIVDPKRLVRTKADEKAQGIGEEDAAAFRESIGSIDFQPISKLERELMQNPYTIHQALSFMEAAPLLKIYSVTDGVVTINAAAARAYTLKERLSPPEFDIDTLRTWDRPLSPEQVRACYASAGPPTPDESTPDESVQKLESITAATWNIFHGGKHFTPEEHGWDSRVAVADMLRREKVDLVMMQETYSSGDFIAAELGYYYATTADWDYLNQGANLSVISRYPILELHVPPESTFMNVAVKVAISETREMYVMSNWYGMKQFPDVFEFHRSRFGESDTIPTLFAGDFNAVPHTDGGDSLASRALLGAGFVDAFRNLHPDVEKHPGHSHRSGRRIDQIFYKGKGLTNRSTQVVSTAKSAFPSDHYLIISTFDLD